MKNMKKLDVKFLFLFILIVIGFIVNRPKSSIVVMDKLITIDEVGDSLTYDNVRDYLIIINVKHPAVVLKQALLETGYFKCTNCSLDDNNLFGFKYHDKYIKFSNWKESVHYYANWQYYKGYSDTLDYYEFLDNIGYATSITYEQKLKSM
jgi:hypothetical protein